MNLKTQIRILGVDDSSFEFKKSKSAWLVGAIFRGNLWLEGVLVDKIEVDGMDSTTVITNMIEHTKFATQIRVVFLDGITFGGFNIVDIQGLYENTGVPIVTIVEKPPDLEKIRGSLMRFSDFELRWSFISKMGEPKSIRLRGSKKPLYVQCVGLKEDEVIRVLELSRKACTIPEALRVARMFASALPII